MTNGYSATAIRQGNGTWLVYGINQFGNRHAVKPAREEAMAWARDAGFAGIMIHDREAGYNGHYNPL